MSRRHYRRGLRGGLSSTVDDAAHIASKFGPVGALWTGTIGFSIFYAALPTCTLALTTERKASFKGPTAASLASVLDQVLWQRFISPCQWAGVAILLVCVAIAIWKHLDRGDLNGDDVTFLSATSKFISSLVEH